MIKTNDFLLISKPSTASLQMLIKFRACKNELWERQPYGCSLPRAGAQKLEGEEHSDRDRKIVLLTKLIRATTDQPRYSKTSTLIVNVVLKANFVLSTEKQEKLPAYSCPINKSVHQPTNESVYSINLKRIETNKQTNNNAAFTVFPQHPGHQVINGSHSMWGETLCSSVPLS